MIQPMISPPIIVGFERKNKFGGDSRDSGGDLLYVVGHEGVFLCLVY
jgi:hypothetical protein